MACDSGGKIEFHDGHRESEIGVPRFNLVPASVALAIEPGKSRANGYHAKLEINPVGGQKLKSGSGYELKLKYTGRSP
jgi:hypothetical protein